ncbi:hypothetical protein AB07_0816 [Citrobacter freundii]|nr:hypothetical protein AB07_0816 [Citrobacter freundii]
MTIFTIRAYKVNMFAHQVTKQRKKRSFIQSPNIILEL